MENRIEDSRKKMKTCSICKSNDHNRRTCPQRVIEDTSLRRDTEEYTEECITIDPKREALIKNLLDREAYEIEPDIFEVWLHNNRPCHLREIRHLMDRKLNKDSIMLYLRLLNDLDEYY